MRVYPARFDHRGYVIPVYWHDPHTFLVVIRLMPAVQKEPVKFVGSGFYRFHMGSRPAYSKC